MTALFDSFCSLSCTYASDVKDRVKVLLLDLAQLFGVLDIVLSLFILEELLALL
jgi:hypothetical protein